MNVIPLVIMGALLLGLLFVSNRNKAKKAAADVERRKAMAPGTKVMTTSGLHGTIVAVDPDNDGSTADTVVVRIAPGVEVTWALAAVREAPARVTGAPATPTELGAAAAPRTDLDDAPHDAGPAGTPANGAVRINKPKGRAAER